MLVTLADGGLHARPMAFAEVRDNGDIYFSTRIETPKVKEIEADDRVLVTLQGKTKFVSLSGRASIVRERALIERLWKESWRVWVPNGKDDPALCIIAVDAESAQYWDNSGARGVRYLYRAAKAYLQRTTPESGDADLVGQVRL